MKYPKNHDMVKIDDVLKLLDNISDDLRQDRKIYGTTFDQLSSELAIIDKIKRAVRSLETRRRLIVINGGKDEQK